MKQHAITLAHGTYTELKDTEGAKGTEDKLLWLEDVYKRQALTSLTPDASIKAGTFQFTPPQGITVENLMNQDAPERPLLQ